MTLAPRLSDEDIIAHSRRLGLNAAYTQSQMGKQQLHLMANSRSLCNRFVLVKSHPAEWSAGELCKNCRTSLERRVLTGEGQEKEEIDAG